MAGAQYTLGDGEIGWYYSYGVYFLYNVGYQAQAGVALKGIPNRQTNARYAYATPMNFSILPITRFESSPSQGSAKKRSLTVLPRVPRRGLLEGPDSKGLSPIPSKHIHSHLSKHKHHARQGHALYVPINNASSGAEVDFLLGKRQSSVGQGNANLTAQQQITGAPSLIQCAGNNNQMPEFRLASLL